MNDTHRPEPPAAATGPAWYVTQIKPNCSSIAQRNLARIGCTIFAPYEEVTLRRGSQFRGKPRPLFPGYLFARFDPAQVACRSVNSTYGVSRLLSFSGERPAPVPQDLITSLMQRCDQSGKLLTTDSLAKGDQIMITSGPFANFTGSVEAVAPQQRIWVLLEIMGAVREVAIDATQARIAGGRGTAQDIAN